MYWYNNVRCLIYMCDICHLCIDTIIYPPARRAQQWHTDAIPMCDVTHSYVWNDELIFVMCLIYICDTYNGTPMPFTFVTWQIQMYKTVCSHVQYASITYVTHVLAHQCHLHVWHDSFICMKWHVHMCDMPHLHMWHMQWHTNAIHMCDMTHSYVWNHMFTSVMCLVYIRDTCNGSQWHSYVQHDPFRCVIRANRASSKATKLFLRK